MGLRERLRRALRGGHLTGCFRCGGFDQVSRVAPRKSWAAGQTVSGRLWYCPNCSHWCCIPCARRVERGIVCPKCGGYFDPFGPIPAADPRPQEVEPVEPANRGLEPSPVDELVTSLKRGIHDLEYLGSLVKRVGGSGDPRAVIVLLEARVLHSGLKDYIFRAVRDLGTGPESLQIPAEARASLHEDLADIEYPYWTAGTAALLLTLCADASSVEPLIAALNHPSTEVAQLAAATLGRLGDRRAVRPLIEALRRGESFLNCGGGIFIQDGALIALGRLGDRSAVPVLLDRLETADPGEIRDVAKALLMLRDARAIEPLRHALEKGLRGFPAEAVRSALAESDRWEEA